jgi:hypothetical protein
MNPLTTFPASRSFFGLFCFIFGFLCISTATTNAQLIYADSFNYPDGQIDNTPGSPWVMNYTPSNQMSVISGRAFLSATNQESVRYNFTNSYNDGALYARMVVNASTLPSGIGNFFACFRQSSTDSLWARIWMIPSSGALGSYRFAVSVGGGTAMVAIDRDLYPGTNYTLVVRYAVSNNYSTLWLNPTDESDTNNIAQDLRFFGVVPMQHFALVEAFPGNPGEIGNLTVDDVRIGRSFMEVLPGVRFNSISNALSGGFNLRASGQATSNYVFQATTNTASANWLNLSTNAAGTNGNFNLSDPSATNFPSRFYRLLRQ